MVGRGYWGPQANAPGFGGTSITVIMRPVRIKSWEERLGRVRVLLPNPLAPGIEAVLSPIPVLPLVGIAAVEIRDLATLGQSRSFKGGSR
jgi:hypothetical protein